MTETVYYDLGTDFDELRTITVYAYGDRAKPFEVTYTPAEWTGEFLDRVTCVGQSKPEPIIDPTTGEPLMLEGKVAYGPPRAGLVGLELSTLMCEIVKAWTLRMHGEVIALEPNTVNKRVKTAIMWNVLNAIQDDQMAPKGKSKNSKGSFVTE